MTKLCLEKTVNVSFMYQDILGPAMSWFRDCGIVKKAMDDALQSTQEQT